MHTSLHPRALSQTEERAKERERDSRTGLKMKRRMCCSRWLKVWIFLLLFTFINSFFLFCFFFSFFLVQFFVLLPFRFLTFVWHCRYVFVVAAIWRLVLVVDVVVCGNYFIYGMKFFTFLFCPLKSTDNIVTNMIFDEIKSKRKLRKKRRKKHERKHAYK